VLDREVVREFLDEEFKDMEIPDDIFREVLPDDIFREVLEVLIEVFYKYIEDDYYEWLKGNFKSFFNYGNPDWQWVRERIKKYGR